MKHLNFPQPGDFGLRASSGLPNHIICLLVQIGKAKEKSL